MSFALLIAARLCLPALNAPAGLLSPVASAQGPFEPAVVKLERRDGVELWTVRAREASVRALLTRVGELSGLEVDASSALERAPLITITLERRPLAEVLEFALGSAGLRVDLAAHEIRVRADRNAEETPEQQAMLAAEAWTRAAERHPLHPQAASARLAQGELEELRGNGAAARERYLALVRATPASATASEAYLRAGRIASARGDWGEACEHFRALANLPGAEEYRAVARVELARATLGLGDAPSALHILEALDASHPCWERTELSARALVRIEALLAEARFEDALAVIEGHESNFDPLGLRELPRLRARALEGAGLGEEAARAWLLVAREAPAPARIGAYQSAVRLAEESGDPMAVLFVAREATLAGFGAAVSQAERRARAALGVVDPLASSPAPRAELRLEQAERWLAQRELERATPELELLFEEREGLALDALGRARLALAWADCLATREGIDAAADMARAERERIAPGEARERLDRGLARLLEARGLFERAADAYRGDF